MKDVKDMSIDELKEFLKRRGFLDDEIELTFKTEFDLREAVKDIRKLMADDEEGDETQGWDDEDKTELTRDQLRTIESGRKQREKRQEMLKELKAKKKGLKLDKSIKDSGGKVSKKEVESSMADIAKLLGEGDLE